MGRRVLIDPAEYGMKLQEAGLQLQQTFAVGYVPKGVYRFRTHEEANQWLMQMMIKAAAKRN